MKHDELDMKLQEVERFFDKDVHFQVPHYQRNYSWEEDHVKLLLEDLENAMSSFPEDLYLLGQVLVCPNESKLEGLDSDVKSFELIDGQQRATTVYLLFVLLLRSLDPDWIAQQVQGDKQKIDYWNSLQSLPNNVDPNHAISRLRLASGDSTFWDALLAGEGFPEATTPTEENLGKARLAIQDFIEEFKSEDEKFAFLRFLMKKVSFIRLVLPTAQHALRMFMKINNRGMRLDPSDIIKSYIFQEARPEDYEDLSRRWAEAQDLLFNKARLSRIASMQFLMKVLIGVKTGKSVRGDDLFDEWLEFLKKDGDGQPQNNVQILADSLPTWADRLVRVSRRETPVSHKTTDLLRGSYEIKAVQQFEVLIAGSQLEQDGYDHLCRIVEDRIMLSSWAKEKNGLLEQVIHPWAFKTHQLDPAASKSEILKAAGKAVSKTEIEELFEAALPKLRRGFTYETQSHHPRIRYFLARVNQEVQRVFSVAVPSVDDLMKTTKGDGIGFDLDHVFPRASHRLSDWKVSETVNLAQGEQDRSSRVINSIGNLVLLHSADNKFNNDALPWDENKVISFANSELYINKLLTESGRKEISKHAPNVAKMKDLGWPDGLSLESWSEDSTGALMDFYWGVMERSIRKNMDIS